MDCDVEMDCDALVTGVTRGWCLGFLAHSFFHTLTLLKVEDGQNASIFKESYNSLKNVSNTEENYVEWHIYYNSSDTSEQTRVLDLICCDIANWMTQREVEQLMEKYEEKYKTLNFARHY